MVCILFVLCLCCMVYVVVFPSIVLCLYCVLRFLFYTLLFMLMCCSVCCNANLSSHVPALCSDVSLIHANVLYCLVFYSLISSITIFNMRHED